MNSDRVWISFNIFDAFSLFVYLLENIYLSHIHLRVPCTIYIWHKPEYIHTSKMQHSVNITIVDSVFLPECSFGRIKPCSVASWANFSSKNFINATAHSTHKYVDASQVPSVDIQYAICFCANENMELCYLNGEMSHRLLSHNGRMKKCNCNKFDTGNKNSKTKTKTKPFKWIESFN